MAGSHYPDYYLKKRRRDTTYRRIVSIVVGVLLFAVVGGCTGFLVWNMVIKPSREHAPQPADQARQRNELNTEKRIAEAQSNTADQDEAGLPGETIAAVPGTGDVSTELSGVEYAQSVPAIKVSIEGSNKAATKQPEPGSEETTGTQDGGDTQQAAAPTPPGERDQPASFNSKPEEKPKPEAKVETPKEEPKPEEKPVETKTEEKPAASGDRVFHVYAGACSTQDDAEKMKSNLSSLGFQGTIIKSKLDYLVKVASLDDYDSANSLIAKLQASGFEKAFATRSRN